MPTSSFPFLPPASCVTACVGVLKTTNLCGRKRFFLHCCWWAFHHFRSAHFKERNVTMWQLMSKRGQGGIGICLHSLEIHRSYRIKVLQRVSAVGLNCSYLDVEPHWFANGKFPFPSSVKGHSRVWLSVLVFNSRALRNLRLTHAERYKIFNIGHSVTLVDNHYLNIEDRPSVW